MSVEAKAKRATVRWRGRNDPKHRPKPLKSYFEHGVVRYYAEQVSSKRGRKGTRTGENAPAAHKIIEVIHAGLPYTELKDLRTVLNVSTERLAPMLGISRATLHRHTDTSKRFDLNVSDRIVRFARLFGKAIEALGNQEDARQWLNSPQFGLGGSIPLEFATTEIGAREVENLLGRIQYGVYS
jgi:putative toxin-antitoxin system antitoxin component (TIGR02293 family)